MKIAIDFVEELKRDDSRVGRIVLACWTNSNNAWHGKAEVVKVNKMSLICKLLHPVGGPGMYPAGQEIRVPRAFSNVKEWTVNNCALEWKDEYAEAIGGTK